MVASPTTKTTPALDSPGPDQAEHAAMNTRTRLCAYCDQSEALLYCRADSAKLCLSCDKEVHATNQLFTKHYRSQLCDACDSAPASVFCETEQRVLCQSCDWEIHTSPGFSMHSRRPIEGFTGCPSVIELASIIGFDDLGSKALSSAENGVCDNNGDDGYGFSDFLIWETPQVVSLNDLVVSSQSGHNYRAMEVPPLPKNRNAACGKHKEEMLRQLRQLGRSESNSGSWPNLCYPNPELEANAGLQSMAPQPELRQENAYAQGELDMNFPALSHEESGLQWLNESSEPPEQGFLPLSLLSGLEEEESHTGANKGLVMIGEANEGIEGHRGGPHLPVTTGTLSVVPEVYRHEINTQERDSAISRYKEKKKLRRYDKHIRYESRKIRAESRTRIKGRFAKIER